jgi:hypothetical protein
MRTAMTLDLSNRCQRKLHCQLYCCDRLRLVLSPSDLEGKRVSYRRPDYRWYRLTYQLFHHPLTYFDNTPTGHLPDTTTDGA